MATPAPRPRKQAPPPPQATPVTPDTICLPIPVHRYRVLFADGALVDFLVGRDTSDTRADMLDAHYGKRPQASRHDDPSYRIEGIAHLGEEYVYTPHPTMGTVTVNVPMPPSRPTPS